MNIKFRYLLTTATALIIFDVVTTFYGFDLGFIETNRIAVLFTSVYGNQHGILLAALIKISLLIIPYLLYRKIRKDLTPRATRLCMVCYTSVVLVAAASALNASISNVLLIWVG